MKLFPAVCLCTKKLCGEQSGMDVLISWYFSCMSRTRKHIFFVLWQVINAYLK